MRTATSLCEVVNGQFSWHLFFPKMSSHIDLCAVDGIHCKIEKTRPGNKEGHTNELPQLTEFQRSRDSSQGEEGLSGRDILYVQQTGGLRTASKSFRMTKEVLYDS